MKKISLLLIVSLCLLGGCKDDLLKEGGGENGFTTVGTNYLSFNIVSDGGATTRANWPTEPADDKNFHVGDPEETERAITSVSGSNVAILFNDDYSFHSMCNLSYDADIQDVTDRYEAGLEKSIGKFTANVKIAEGEEEKLPSKVLIVLNGNPDRLVLLRRSFESREDKSQKLPLYNEKPSQNDAEYVLAYLTRRLSDAVINTTNASVVIYSPSLESEEEYCTMSNSVYVGTGDLKGDERAGQTGTIYDLVEIKANIESTKEAAQSNPATVHVERLAVKVEVEVKGTEGETQVEELGSPESSIVKSGLNYPVLIKPQTGNQVQLAEGADAKKAKPVDWAFTMLGWSINAVARRMYLFKNLNDARGDITDHTDNSTHYKEVKEGESEVKRTIETLFFSNWNDALHARCYWAVDGHYADPSVYPVQYREAMDNTSTNSFVQIQDRDKKGEGTDDERDGTQNMPLYYYSYTQMRMISMGLTPISADLVKTGELNEENYATHMQRGILRKNLKYRYCGENVLGQTLIKDPTHVWRGAATHVVFFGQLLLDKEVSNYEKAAKAAGRSTEELLKSVSDKLYAAGCYWNRAGYMQYAYSQIFNVLKASSRTIKDYFGKGDDIKTPATDFHLYYKNADDTGEECEIKADYFTNTGIDLEALNAVHDDFNYKAEDCNGSDNDKIANCIFRLSAAQVSNGDGRVMLGLKKAYKLIIKGKDERNVDITPITITPEKFLSIAYSFAGVADYYALGRMYYYAPIYHAATGLAATGAAPEKVGDIGVVRNHWYKLTVNSLLKPGIPVTDPSQPIIPNIDPSDRYLGLEIHVLPWHLINQTVTLQ